MAKKGANPVDKEDLERHDKWLCMMWPRLKILHELLSNDGIIMVSINEIEYSSLKSIMDEIFGENKFLSSLIWKSRQIVDSRPLNGISNDHEYVLVYGKSDDVQFEGKASDISKYSNPDNDPRGPWMSNSILGLATKEQRPNLHYEIFDPKTRISYKCPENSGWRYSPQTMNEKIKDGRIIFPKKAEGRPREKKFLSELAKSTTGFSSILDPEKVGFTLNGTRELRDIFGENVFPFPKPHNLIKTLIQQVTEEEDIILDSFAGSGTTAHAVLALNQEDGANRKFILVECEEYADKVTAERVRRVIKGVPNTKDEELKKGLLGSFTFSTLGDEISLNGLLKGNQLPDYQSLARYVFYTATGRTLDVVAKPRADYLVGETDLYRVHLIYKPDRDFLRSSESALNAEMAERISKSNQDGKKCLVFATAKFMGQRELTEQRIEFCQLPYAIHRVLGG